MEKRRAPPEVVEEIMRILRTEQPQPKPREETLEGEELE
jgi:hypothetical protein